MQRKKLFIGTTMYEYLFGTWMVLRKDASYWKPVSNTMGNVIEKMYNNQEST